MDYIACGIMGYTVEEVKHLMYYLEKHNTNVSKITTYGEKPGDVTRPFARVKMDTLIPPGVTVYNQNACSACMNALLLSFRFMKTDILKSTGVFLGDALPEVTGNEEVTVAFGNCCMKKDATIIVKGCPPYPFLLKEKLS